MTVEYSEVMFAITKGLLKHREEEIIAQMILQTEHSLGDLTDGSRESFEKIQLFQSETAFNILHELKELLGDDLKVMEEGNEVDFEE